MPSARLTKRVADGADLTLGRHCVWDTEVKGFGLQIEPTGTKTYIVRYRPKGLGRSASRRYYKIGRHGDLTCERAREQAKYLLGLVAIGQDPAAAQHAQRQRAAEDARPARLAEVGAIFLEDHAAVRCKRSTVQLYELMLRRHILPQLGKHPVGAITKGQVRALHHSLRDHIPTANRALQLISSLYSFAARKELVPEGFNPARGIQKYREVSRERYLSSAELQRLGAALIEAETIGIPWQIDETNPKAKHTPKTWNDQRQHIDPHAVAAIRLLLFTGARLREILHLQWAHVELERGLLLLPDSKTGKKTIVLNGAALDVVAQLKVIAATSPSSFVIKGLIEGKPRADLKKPWLRVAIQQPREPAAVITRLTSAAAYTNSAPHRFVRWQSMVRTQVSAYRPCPANLSMSMSRRSGATRKRGATALGRCWSTSSR